MNILIVVDMQNDFVSGALGSADAQAIVGGVAARVREAADAGERVVFTLDTHGPLIIDFVDAAEKYSGYDVSDIRRELKRKSDWFDEKYGKEHLHE